jgi:hypothetical protein
MRSQQAVVALHLRIDSNYLRDGEEEEGQDMNKVGEASPYTLNETVG